MNSKSNPELLDEVNPDWTVDCFARAKPANEVLAKLFGESVATALLKPRGKSFAAVLANTLAAIATA